MTQISLKKIGIIGLGSIGMRHCTELIKIGNVSLFSLRTNKGVKEIPTEIKEHVTFVYDENEFLNLNLDGYIISNPTSLHIKAINLIARTNKPIFLEKPLCNSLSEIGEIEYINKDLIQIGFCLRFNSIIKRVKEIIEGKILGKVYMSKLNVGHYLPTWHPYTDYRTEYFSQKKLGGGAIRTLSHEIDLAFYFFGKPTKTITYTEKTSNLEIDVDDYALLLLSFNNKHISRIEIDVIAKKKERKGVIYGEIADLHYDMFEKTIKVYDVNGDAIIDENVSDNNMYYEQMLTFLDLIKSKKNNSYFSSWDENIEIMKIIENEKPI